MGALAGRRATGGHEPCQVRKEAALSGSACVVDRSRPVAPSNSGGGKSPANAGFLFCWRRPARTRGGCSSVYSRYGARGGHVARLRRGVPVPGAGRSKGRMPGWPCGRRPETAFRLCGRFPDNGNGTPKRRPARRSSSPRRIRFARSPLKTSKFAACSKTMRCKAREFRGTRRTYGTSR